MATERHKGDRVAGIPTDDWNEFCQSSKAVKQLLKAPSAVGQQSGSANLSVIVFNTTGDLIDAAFPILKLSAPIFTFEDRESVIYEGILFNGETPDADTDISDIAIVQGPIADGLQGAAIYRGHSWCEVEVSDDTHTHAAPSDGENTKLTSGTSGAKIIWKESGTGTKKAVVDLGGGGGGDALTLYYMILTTDVDPATGDQDEIISSAGLGQRYTTEPTEVDGEFKRTKNGDPIDVINFDTCQGYDAGTAVWVAQSDLLGYWEIISAACCTVDEGA